MKMFEYDPVEREQGLQDLELELNLPIEMTAEVFQFIPDLGMDDWVESKETDASNILAMTNLFQAAYKKELGENETIELQNLGKKAFAEMLKRGLNKEQIRLALLKKEKVWTEDLVREGKKPTKERSDATIDWVKTNLKEIYGLTDSLDRIKSPYDKLFDISTQIADLEQENNKINQNPKSSDSDFKQYDRNQERIDQLRDKLAKETAKYDPRIIQDAIEDKMASVKLESEIECIKKGKVINNNVECLEANKMRQNLMAIKKQVQNDIKIVEQNNEHNI